MVAPINVLAFCTAILSLRSKCLHPEALKADYIQYMLPQSTVTLRVS